MTQRSGHIFHTFKKYLKDEHVKQYWREKGFKKLTKHYNFELFWGPKCPRDLAFEAHIENISESTSNEHKRAYWC